MSQPDWPPTLHALLSTCMGRSAYPADLNQRFSLFWQAYRPQTQRLPMVKVAGTNGKGSTCAMLEACLNGKKDIGLFTSPHLVSPTERIRLHGQNISTDALELGAQRVQSFLDQWSGPTLHPTFFEIMIAIALDFFLEHGAAFAIVEAGVGGYHDAVHLLPGDLAAITTVDLDHMKQLGPHIATIAKDKAGIVPHGGSLVLGPGLSAVARQAVLTEVGTRNVTLIEATRTVEPTGNLAPPLPGQHQWDNLGTVLALGPLIEQRFGIPFDTSHLNQTQWAGRLEARTFQGRPLLVDVAHNVESLRALKDYLDETIPFERRFLIYGAAGDKEVDACMALVGPLAPNGFIVGGFYRAADPKVLAQLPGTDHLTPMDDIHPALAGIPADKDVVTLVCGSVFLAGLVSQLAD